MNRYFQTTNRSKARLVGLIVTVAVLIAGAVTVVSRQAERAATARAQHSHAAVTAVSVRASSQDKSIAQTTPVQELTPDEARILTEAVKPLVNKSTEGLVEATDADGGVSVDVKDRFQNVTVARRNADGSISYSCIDTPESASAFFQPERSRKQPTGTRSAPVRY